MKASDIMIELIRCELCSGQASPETVTELRSCSLSPLYSLAKHHDMAHIVAAALDSLGILSDTPDKESKELFVKERMLSVFRARRLTDELSSITATLEAGGVDHIALKGSVLRELYPEPWMRTSCDIDILVKKDDLDKARDMLIEKLGYKYTTKTEHDISLVSPTGVHLELHFVLVSEATSAEAGDILRSVWEYAYLSEGKRFTCLLADEFFYFYHIAHMAKHFMMGGCGVKPFLDLYILDSITSCDKSARDALLSKGKLLEFTNGVRALTEVWFSYGKGDSFTLSLERFILNGGTYGTLTNGVSVGVAKRKGRCRYLLSRIFLSYSAMKRLYPTLLRHKWLTPFYHVRRWCRIIFCGGLGKAKGELKNSTNVTQGTADETAELLSRLGLNSN